MSVQTVKEKTEFDGIVKDNRLVFVDFYATWCGPCKMIAPKIEEFAKEYSNVIFLKVDVDEASEIAEAEGISAMPTFKLYKDGNKMEEVVGASEAKIKEALGKLVA